MQSIWTVIASVLALFGLSLILAQSQVCGDGQCVFVPIILGVETDPKNVDPPTSAATPTSATLPTSAIPPTSTDVPAGTPTPDPTPLMIYLIDAGIPEDSEDLGYVVIRNTSQSPIDLTGWTLVNSSRFEIAPFVFPAYVLDGGAAVEIRTEAGANEEDVLYWGRRATAWFSGDAVLLGNADGVEQDRSVIP
jgi:hypothetical protein